MNQLVVRKAALSILWVGAVVYTFGFAPPTQPDTFDLIKHLSTGQVAGINPLIVALFNILGVFPIIYCGLLFADGRQQKIPAYPFALASFAVGAFALLPYLILRNPDRSFAGNKTLLLKILDSRWFGGGVAIAATLLVIYGLSQGNWNDFIAQWQTSRFIHVMSLDFCLLCLLIPALLGDDMARRGLADPRLFWTVSLIPFWGSAFYLAFRPPIIAKSSHSLSSAPDQP